MSPATSSYVTIQSGFLVAVSMVLIVRDRTQSPLLNCVVIAVLFLALGALALWADRRLSRERATMSA